jgi:PAS domain S-box-containing protein
MEAHGHYRYQGVPSSGAPVAAGSRVVAPQGCSVGRPALERRLVVESRGPVGRERAEEDLRQQRDLCRSLLRTQSEVDEGFVIAEGWRIDRASEAFCRISGYGAAELEGLASFLELIVPEQRAQAGVYVRRRLRNEEVGDRMEVAIVHKSGRRVELEIAVKMLCSDGRARFVMIASPPIPTTRPSPPR